jgi:transposase
MKHIEGISRSQLYYTSIEMNISKEHPVRVIEAFVDKLELEKLGYKLPTVKTEGRPSYEPKIFLKIYLYGYINGIRSSRRLEKECIRNIELHWLLHKLVPNYHSIADFRKHNSQALKNTFKLFVLFLKDVELIAGSTIAIDGTKVRAHNSKKNNYSDKKIARHIEYIETKTNEYLQQIETNDAEEDTVQVKNIEEKIARLQINKINYEILREELIQSGEPQISTTDKDARALLVQGQVVEVSYNVQAAVDEKHKLVVATHTINRNDRNALSDIALEAKENLGVATYTALVDKGYHNGRQIQQCTDATISTIVANPEIVNSNEKGTTPDYVVTKFVYHHQTDTYTCPAGETLSTKGTWHKKTRDKNSSYQFKKYRTPACKDCAVKHLCTGRVKGGREIERSEFAQAVADNNQRYKENQSLYRKRQEINEHIFGTIKRKWGYNHTNLKGLEKVNGEMALIMTVYNLKRSMNILGIATLIEKLKNWKIDYSRIAIIYIKRSYLELKSVNLFFEVKIYA